MYSKTSAALFSNKNMAFQYGTMAQTVTAGKQT
jgi:hypothetical protein